MRIVYTVLNGTLAGGQVICGNILLASREAGHQVRLLTPSYGEFTEILESEKVPVAHLPMLRTFHLHRAWQFARFLIACRADLVHCHAAVSGTILARLGAKLAGIPIITHVHIPNKFSDVSWVRTVQVWLDNFTSRLTERIVAVSEDTRDSLILQGVAEHKVRVIYNGVQMVEETTSDLSARARGSLGITGEGPVIGTVARLCPVKGQRDFVIAAKRVRREFPNARFAVVGSDLEFGGGYRHLLENLACELGVDDCVQFMGFRRDAASLMYAFDLFVLPSWIEGLPVTILEAMAVGKPVVATPVGGVPELVVEGETGLLVPPCEPEQLSQAIIYLLRNPEVARGMGTNGRQRVIRHFSQKQMLDQVMGLYEEICKKTPS